ncbi:acyl-CoA dehydrogenase [Sphingobium sp. Sx8-8]|uniref:acyl-CoA dehydrogenase n=1 Tax=Sphingobium sp. Sx8-8 TaxID=2933617 RepID=UPI001F59956A|nr:acyl-CoA dehydrogenase [Sphingobium sp. Sx8-8]
MSILYDEAQVQIGEEARRQLNAVFAPEKLKELLETRGGYDEVFWNICREQGWTAIGIPEDFGGIGMGLIELGLIAEACGSVVSGAPFLGTSFGAGQAILEYGSQALKQDWLPRLAAGDVIGAVAFAEGRDFIPAQPSLRLSEGRLTGTKPAVPAGGKADVAVVLASGEAGPVLALVQLDQPGVTRTLLETFDNSRNTADLAFEGAQALVLEGAADGRAAALEILRRQAVVTAHEQVGGAERAMTAARDYALTRRAFGQPIGAFQSVKHRIAEDYVLVEMARANAIDAAASFGTPEFARCAAAARITGTEAYDTVSRDATQTHGGIGVTWEENLHLHQRRARTLAIEQGNLIFWEDRLVEALTAASTQAAAEESSGDPVLDAYRAKAKAWLESHVAEFGAAAQKGLSEEEGLALGRRWMATRYDAGYVGISWPKEHGGQGLTHLEKLAFDKEEMKHGFPTGYFGVSLGMPVPIILRHLPDGWKHERARAAMRGEEIWCQLFSEPAAGSDLAGLRTRAVQDEATGDWIVNGQKLWTTWAQHSDYGVIVVRTDPNVPKHRGLTYFWVDMKAPGVTVRPVKLAAGDSHVNEVFFDDVRLPDSQRIGAVGGGFAVAMETLMIERYQATDPSGFGPPLALLIGQAQEGTLNGRAPIEDGRVRERIARTHAVQNAMAAVGKRALLSLQAGLEPGPEGALHKLVSVRARQKLSEFAIDLQGVAGMEHPYIHVSSKSSWQQSWMTAPTGRIAGGADEMLLNTIAERILGLPQDHRPDKGVPFNAIPK